MSFLQKDFLVNIGNWTPAGENRIGMLDGEIGELEMKIAILLERCDAGSLSADDLALLGRMEKEERLLQMKFADVAAEAIYGSVSL